jgi:acyl-CoA reductase-like NAD-dependent aldehyde dehydrogenase
MQPKEIMFIGGEFRRATGAVHTLIAPATEHAHATVAYASVADVDAAVAAAQEAAAAWAAMAPAARAAVVATIGLQLQSQSEELARAFALEIGTPLAGAQQLQVDPALRAFAQAPDLATRVAAIEPLGTTRIRRVPIGVAACITPWNYPLYQVATKIVPALVAGVPVILKPSELAPLSLRALAEAAQLAGLPRGVLNIVLGGPEIGRHLVKHAGVDMVSFTGSTAIGREVAANAGAGLKKVTLELGGKSASIVLPDGDLPAAVRQTLAKCLQNSGQTCAALTRLLVPRQQLDAAVELAVSEALTYRMGDPFAPSTRLGPVISAAHRDKIIGLITRAVAAGAVARTGGAERQGLPERGYFVAPTVLEVAGSDFEIVQEEVFGPVLTLQAYETESEAVDAANDTVYGLAGAVWSRDPARAERLATQLRAGSVSINGARTHPEAPFGGFRASGFGRERGRHGLDAYLTLQALHT